MKAIEQEADDLHFLQSDPQHYDDCQRLRISAVLCIAWLCRQVSTSISILLLLLLLFRHQVEAALCLKI